MRIGGGAEPAPSRQQQHARRLAFGIAALEMRQASAGIGIQVRASCDRQETTCKGRKWMFPAPRGLYARGSPKGGYQYQIWLDLHRGAGQATWAIPRQDRSFPCCAVPVADSSRRLQPESRVRRLGPAKTVANLRRGLAKAIRPSRSLPADRNSLTLLLDYDLS